MFDFEAETEFRAYLAAEFPGARTVLVATMGKSSRFEQVAIKTAARRLANGTHRLVGEDERRGLKDQQQALRPRRDRKLDTSSKMCKSNQPHVSPAEKL